MVNLGGFTVFVYSKTPVSGLTTGAGQNSQLREVANIIMQATNETVNADFFYQRKWSTEGGGHFGRFFCISLPYQLYHWGFLSVRWSVKEVPLYHYTLSLVRPETSNALYVHVY